MSDPPGQPVAPSTAGLPAPATAGEPARSPNRKRPVAAKPAKAAADRGRPFPAEVELYAPVKRFLEARGYEVKGEVRGCDVVAVRGPDEPPVIVELKLAFTLAFVLQGVDRLAVTDHVYLAVPAARPRRANTRAAFTPDHQGVRRLCRRLGLGLLAVHPGAGRVEVVLDPDPQRLPRRSKTRAKLVLREHARRHGDPTPGGKSGAIPAVTAYRQEALRCADLLRRNSGGPLPVAKVREEAEAPNAARVLYRNVYGWFEPAGRGVYRLTEEGARGLEVFEGRFENPIASV